MDTTRLGVEFGQQVDRLRGTVRAANSARLTHLALVVSAQTDRKALDRCAAYILNRPVRVAALVDTNTDPMLLAALAGDRAMRNLSGLPELPADRGVPMTSLEQLAARACREHLHLCSTDPGAARAQEASWLATRSAFRSGFLAEPIAAMEATYGAAAAVAQDTADGRRSLTLPPREWVPSGVMRSVAAVVPDLPARSASTPLLSTSPRPWQAREGARPQGIDRFRYFVARGGIGRAEQLARRAVIRPLLGRSHMRRGLNTALARGPEATRQFLLRASSNPRRAATLIQMRVDPMIVAAALGRPAMAAVAAGQPVPGGGNLGRLCETLARADRARVERAADPTLTADERSRILDDTYPKAGADVVAASRFVNEAWAGRPLPGGPLSVDANRVAPPALSPADDFQRAWEGAREARADLRDADFPHHEAELQLALQQGLDEPTAYGTEDWVGDAPPVPADPLPAPPVDVPVDQAHSAPPPISTPDQPHYRGPSDPGRSHDCRLEMDRLYRAIEQGPRSADAYLRSAAASPHRAQLLVEAKLDPMIVAAAMGPRAMAAVTVGHAVKAPAGPGPTVNEDNQLARLCNKLADLDRTRLDGIAGSPAGPGGAGASPDREALLQEVLSSPYADGPGRGQAVAEYLNNTWDQDDGKVDFAARWHSVRTARMTGVDADLAEIRPQIVAYQSLPRVSDVVRPVSEVPVVDDPSKAYGLELQRTGPSSWEPVRAPDQEHHLISSVTLRDGAFHVEFTSDAAGESTSRRDRLAQAALEQAASDFSRTESVQLYHVPASRLSEIRPGADQNLSLIEIEPGRWRLDEGAGDSPVEEIRRGDSGAYVVVFKPGSTAAREGPDREEHMRAYEEQALRAVAGAHALHQLSQARTPVPGAGSPVPVDGPGGAAPASAPASVIISADVVAKAYQGSDKDLPRIVEVGANKWELPDDPMVSTVERLPDGSFRVEFRPGVELEPEQALEPAASAHERTAREHGLDPDRALPSHLDAPDRPEPVPRPQGLPDPADRAREPEQEPLRLGAGEPGAGEPEPARADGTGPSTGEDPPVPVDRVVPQDLAAVLPDAIAEGRAPFQDSRGPGDTATAALVTVEGLSLATAQDLEAPGGSQVATELDGVSALACRTWALSQDPPVYDPTFVSAEDVDRHRVTVVDGAEPIRIVQETEQVVRLPGKGPGMDDPIADRPPPHPESESIDDPRLVREADGAVRYPTAKLATVPAAEVPELTVPRGQAGKFDEREVAPDGTREWAVPGDPEINLVRQLPSGDCEVVYRTGAVPTDASMEWAAGQAAARAAERYEDPPALEATVVVPKVVEVYHRSQIADDKVSQAFSKAVRQPIPGDFPPDAAAERTEALLAQLEVRPVLRPDLGPGAGPPSAGPPAVNVHRPSGMADPEYFGAVTYAAVRTAVASEMRTVDRPLEVTPRQVRAEDALVAQMATDRISSNLRLPYAPVASKAHQEDWQRIAADPVALERVTRAADRVVSGTMPGVERELAARRPAPPAPGSPGDSGRAQQPPSPAAPAPPQARPAAPVAPAPSADSGRGSDR